jgi:hypothetical protein
MPEEGYIQVPGGNVWCFAEQPAEFARAVNDFLHRVERGRPVIEPD